MDAPKSQWFVITGGPSSGKTTVIEALAGQGYQTTQEAAKAVIDEALSRGITLEELRQDIVQFQTSIVHLNHLYESALNPADTIFFDRGMHDTLAYLANAGLQAPVELTDIIGQSQYGTVFLFEPLGNFSGDYFRTANEDEAFTRSLNAHLDRIYREAGMEPVHVPAMPVDERVKFVLSHTPLIAK